MDYGNIFWGVMALVVVFLLIALAVVIPIIKVLLRKEPGPSSRSRR